MDQQAKTDLDHADDEILTCPASDEALERAAGQSEFLFRTHMTFSCCMGCD